MRSFRIKRTPIDSDKSPTVNPLSQSYAAVSVEQPWPLTEASLKDDGYDDGHTYKVVSIHGVDVSRDAWALYSYNLFALNGNFDRDGLLFRTLSIYSQYSYDDGASPSTEYDVKERSHDAMIGYQRIFDRFTAAAYVGYEIRDVKISPDDVSNRVRGTKSGFKTA